MYDDYLTDAIEAVLATDLADLPEEAFAEAVRSQACLLAGVSPD